MKAKQRKRRRSIYWILLAVVMVLFLASHVRYNLRSQNYPVWDEQHYVYMASESYRILKHPTLTSINEIFALLPDRQRGYSLLVLPFLLVFGISHVYFWALFVNGLLYVVTIYGVYVLSRVFFSQRTSFIASLLFTCYGWPLFFVNFAYAETATSAVCLWANILLLKTHAFAKRFATIIFAVLFGFALLTRWASVVFILGPLCYTFFQMVRSRMWKKKHVLLNVLIALIIILAVGLSQYIVNFSSVLAYFSAHKIGGPNWQVLKSDEKTFLFSLSYYLRSFWQLGIYFFLLLSAGIVFLLRQKIKANVILIAVCVPWVFFSFFAILKSDRFIIPIYPYLAVVSGAVFEYTRRSRYSFFIIGITIIVCLGSFLGSVWGKGPMKKSLSSIPIVVAPHAILSVYITAISNPPNIYVHSGEEIVDFLEKDSRENKITSPHIVALFSYRRLDEPMYTYNLYHKERPLRFNNFVGSLLEHPEKDSPKFIKQIEEADYLLLKTGKRTDRYFARNNYLALEAIASVIYSDFAIDTYYEKRAEFWIWQDSTKVNVYKKKKALPESVQRELTQKLVDAASLIKYD